jgi:hypothetical protein
VCAYLDQLKIVLGDARLANQLQSSFVWPSRISDAPAVKLHQRTCMQLTFFQKGCDGLLDAHGGGLAFGDHRNQQILQRS